MRMRRQWRAVLIVLMAGGALSGCYYDPYTGGYYPYPPYPYPYPAPYAYPYRPPYSYQAPPPAGYQAPPPLGGPGAGAPPPAAHAPIQQTPLPPATP